MTTNENASLESAIVTQLEFYFGNINLPRDKFLQEKMKEDSGWIPIDTLLTFNRLAKLTMDKELIANAVKQAESDIISLSECNTKIRRNVGNPLPENSLEYWQKLKHTTVYMKGFDLETTLDEIMNYAKKFGHVENVLMRKTKGDKIFKGSAFVTYKTREEAETAQKSDEKFGEIDLIKMMQDDYWVTKSKETKEKRNAEKLAKTGKKAEEIAEKQNAGLQVNFTKGLVLSVSGIPETATIDEIKSFFKGYGNVAYVVHEKDETKIRFSGEENGAKTAWENAVEGGSEGKVLFKEKELSAKVLEGDEEDAYWDAFNKSAHNKHAERGRTRGRGRGGRGGRGRGGRGGRWGRGGGRDNRGDDSEVKEADDSSTRGTKRGATDEVDAPKSKKIVFKDEDDE